MLGDQKLCKSDSHDENALDKAFIAISKDEITQSYIQYIEEQHISYFHNIPGAQMGDTVPSIVTRHSRFDAEHLDGILRYLVGARAHLVNTLGIFPVFNQDAFYRLARDFVVNKILTEPRFQHLVKDTTPLVERSEVKDFPELLEERDLEEAKRSAQDREANQEAAKILKENGVGSDTLLLYYLEGIARSEKSYLGNKGNEHISFENCHQFIIPFRKDDNHYTVAVVQCTQEGEQRCAHIKYYDSLGAGLDAKYKQQLAKFFINMGFSRVLYNSLSKREQRDKYNCALFAGFKAIDIANMHVGDDERLLKNLDNDYAALFDSFRYRVVEMLTESGCNISLSPEFTRQLKATQKVCELQEECQDLKNIECGNATQSEAGGIFSWLGSVINRYTPYFGETESSAKKRSREEFERDNANKEKIKNKEDCILSVAKKPKKDIL
ncbi:hypothetical protein CC99x_010350 [Candidatus Berkiella cookevillensis]|uniref:Uncharacterized protein n=1 Tax=Candidatus Berkiella cookevillensis TaxID=437022 RepID=A0A0Q9YH84_9GAMM|nr:hypothetical protein [Candidatus Berkiella cookevillensis]MCS5709305.1 hypothetical protein [Candidatus Berkiella cookevillensis]